MKEIQKRPLGITVMTILAIFSSIWKFVMDMNSNQFVVLVIGCFYTFKMWKGSRWTHALYILIAGVTMGITSGFLTGLLIQPTPINIIATILLSLTIQIILYFYMISKNVLIFFGNNPKNKSSYHVISIIAGIIFGMATFILQLASPSINTVLENVQPPYLGASPTCLHISSYSIPKYP